MKLEDPGLERLLADYRAERRPSGAQKRRAWAQIDAERRRRRWPRIALVAAVALAAMVLLWIGLGAGSGEVRQLDPSATGHQAPFDRSGSPGGRAVPKVPRSVATEPVSPESTQTVEATEPSPVSSPSSSEPSAPSPARAVSPAREPARATEPSPPGMGELELIEAAESALRRGQLEQALARLSEHAKRFGASDTEEERRALRVLVLCRLGRVAEGRGARWAFLRDYPRSTYEPRIRKACPRS